MPSTSPPTSSPTAWPRNASRAVPDLRRKRRSNGRSVQAVAQMRPQADDADQDQVDRDEVVERARDHQDQNAEDQRHYGADIDDIKHGRSPNSLVPPY